MVHKTTLKSALPEETSLSFDSRKPGRKQFGKPEIRKVDESIEGDSWCD
jgi:hypothetical protein